MNNEAYEIKAFDTELTNFLIFHTFHTSLPPPNITELYYHGAVAVLITDQMKQIRGSTWPLIINSQTSDAGIECIVRCENVMECR